MSLTTEQVLLLENLTYLDMDSGAQVRDISKFEGKTVAEFLTASNINVPEATFGMTSKEWSDIVTAVKNDPTLMNMKICETHIDNAPGGGEGKSVIFVSEEQHEAVVAFKGTEKSAEWKDNFSGANMTDTPQQQNALKWYKEAYDRNGLDDYSVTVTGHSKGGNKAKYITVLDDSVDRCVSFDGQGFSDQFIDKYSDQIASNQHKIENHNANYDYVNELLNDVGDSTYYHAHNIGELGFLENHCPNALLKFDDNGGYSMEVDPNGQPKEIAALDDFLNRYIRSVPESERQDTIDLINNIMSESNNFKNMSTNEIVNYVIDLARDPKYADNIAYLFAFLIKYEQENPELAEAIKSIIKKFGKKEYIIVVDAITSLMNIDIYVFPFGRITIDDILGWLGNIPLPVQIALLELLKNILGIDLSLEQLNGLLEILKMSSSYVNKVDVSADGSDKKVNDKRKHSSGSSGQADFRVDIKKLSHAVQLLKEIDRKILQAEGTVKDAANGLDDGIAAEVSHVIKNSLEKIGQTKHAIDSLSKSAMNISLLYRETERGISQYK